jgi:hypothetical protein
MRQVCNGLAQKPVGNQRELGAWALVELASLLLRVVRPDGDQARNADLAEHRAPVSMQPALPSLFPA